ncbi:hypothetical protein OF83DRAFT_220328 [Amylostereum chailletii]|nr:hypothetical protein OF83DRAFT_220328 [Amylostereum chailletii]
MSHTPLLARPSTYERLLLRTRSEGASRKRPNSNESTAARELGRHVLVEWLLPRVFGHATGLLWAPHVHALLPRVGRTHLIFRRTKTSCRAKQDERVAFFRSDADPPPPIGPHVSRDFKTPWFVILNHRSSYLEDALILSPLVRIFVLPTCPLGIFDFPRALPSPHRRSTPPAAHVLPNPTDLPRFHPNKTLTKFRTFPRPRISRKRAQTPNPVPTVRPS